MKPHPRIRKTIKWGGAVVTLLLVVVWIGSGWWDVGWVSQKLECVDVGYGVVCFERMRDCRPPPRPGLRTERNGQYFLHLGLTWYNHSDGWVLTLPLWIPAALCLLPSAVALRLDAIARRRARLNLCPKCNYDRAGIAKDVVCPECGAMPVKS
jgi:hypothetical protein